MLAGGHIKREEPKYTLKMPRLAFWHTALENEPTLRDQKMTFDWKVPNDFGGGKKEVVEADKMSLNSFERLNAREKSKSAPEIMRET